MDGIIVFYCDISLTNNRIRIMNRDDYISKLFIKNQDKLNQMPADDLWSKLEQQLDASAVDTEANVLDIQSKKSRFSALLVAASVLLLMGAVTFVFTPKDKDQMAFELVLEEPIALLVDALDGSDSDCVHGPMIWIDEHGHELHRRGREDRPFFLPQGFPFFHPTGHELPPPPS